jgi:hypothetical protein
LLNSAVTHVTHAACAAANVAGPEVCNVEIHTSPAEPGPDMRCR